LHRTPGNIAPVADTRLTPITCTCKQHSGNWYAAHEHILTVVEEIVRAAG